MLVEEAVGLDWLSPTMRYGCERRAVKNVALEVFFVNLQFVIG